MTDHKTEAPAADVQHAAGTDATLHRPTPNSEVPPAPSHLDKHPKAFPHAFGRYRIERKLGQGGMGIVYLATDLALERFVALKIPTVSLDDNVVLRERFFREARLAATLQHPNICPTFDVGQFNGLYFLAMAYVEGRPLAEFIKPGQRLPARNVATVVRCLALAMKEAHQKGVIHRDLKPMNIMIATTKQPIIMDFGLARRTEAKDGSMVTQAGVIMGTPEYMPPEQIDGDPQRIGPLVDVYSLGIILYELLAGRPPFQGTTTQLICQIAGQAPPSLRQQRPDIDITLETICFRALKKLPVDRFPDMNAFAAALTDWLAGRKSENIERTQVEIESKMIEDFGAIAEFVTRPLTSGKFGKATPVESAPRRQSLYWSEQATPKEVKAGVKRKRARPAPSGKWLWLRVVLWTALPPLAAILVFGLLSRGYDYFTYRIDARRLNTLFQRVQANPKDASAWRELTDDPTLLKHPQLAVDVGRLLAVETGDWDRADKLFRSSMDRQWIDLAVGTHRQRGDAVWQRGLRETGNAKAPMLWHAAALYREAVKEGQPASTLELLNRRMNEAWAAPQFRDLKPVFNSTLLNFENAKLKLESGFAVYVSGALTRASLPWTLTFAAGDDSSLTIELSKTNQLQLQLNIPRQRVSSRWFDASSTTPMLMVVVFDNVLEVYSNGLLVTEPIVLERSITPCDLTISFATVQDNPRMNINIKYYRLEKYETLAERASKIE